MSKPRKSELQKAIDSVDAEIALLERAKAVLVKQQQATPKRKPRAVVKDPAA